VDTAVEVMTTTTVGVVCAVVVAAPAGAGVTVLQRSQFLIT
jgi:hypothetical protein